VKLTAVLSIVELVEDGTLQVTIEQVPELGLRVEPSV
jgi:hypothetical protein